MVRDVHILYVMEQTKEYNLFVFRENSKYRILTVQNNEIVSEHFIGSCKKAFLFIRKRRYGLKASVDYFIKETSLLPRK